MTCCSEIFREFGGTQEAGGDGRHWVLSDVTSAVSGCLPRKQLLLFLFRPLVSIVEWLRLSKHGLPVNTRSNVFRVIQLHKLMLICKWSTTTGVECRSRFSVYVYRGHISKTKLNTNRKYSSSTHSEPSCTTWTTTGWTIYLSPGSSRSCLFWILQCVQE